MLSVPSANIWGNANFFKKMLNLKNSLQCFLCGAKELDCLCPERKSSGAKGLFLQWIFPEHLLIQTNVIEHINLWKTLTVMHKGMHFAADKCVKDLLESGILVAMKETEEQLCEIWKDYEANPFLNEIYKALGHKWTVDQLKRIGKEAIDSFYQGRWYEISSLGVTLIQNALGESGLDEHDPKNKKLVQINDCLYFIDISRKVIGEDEVAFTLLAPESTKRMRNFALFEPIFSSSKNDV